MHNRLDRGILGSSQTGDFKMYVYIKRTKTNNWTYYYLVIEEYLGNGKRRQIAHIPLKKILEQFNVNAEDVRWCGGWDLNPRRPTPSGPEPDPFDQARAPPRPRQLYVSNSITGY